MNQNTEEGGSSSSETPVSRDASAVDAAAAAAAAVEPSSPIATDTASHSMGLLELAGFAYAFTSSGPFGIESVVSAGGAKAAFASIFLTPIIYVFPQIVMVSELSAMYPSNEGHIIWVEQGWGRAAAAFNAYNAVLMNSIDLSLYPVLASSYVQAWLPQFFETDELDKLFLVRVCFVAIGLFVALRSASIVGDYACFLALLIVVTFVVFFCASLPDVAPTTQWSYAPPGADGGEFKSDYPQLFASSLWLWTGYNNLGAVGGDVAEEDNNNADDEEAQERSEKGYDGDAEVIRPNGADGGQEEEKKPKIPKSKHTSTMFVGLSSACGLSLCTYLLGLISALSVPTERAMNSSSAAALFLKSNETLGVWEDGYLAVAMGEIIPGGATITSVVGLISMGSLFVSSLAAFSRLIWGMALNGWLPHQLAYASKVTKVPIVATVAQAIVILPLCMLTFGYLQRLEFVLASVSYILTFSSFLRLRYTKPVGTVPRPYLVPGGMPVAWLVTLSKIFVFLVILITNFNDLLLMVGFFVVNSSIAGLYWWKKDRFEKNPKFVVEEGEEELHQQQHEARQQQQQQQQQEDDHVVAAASGVDVVVEMQQPRS